MAIPSPQSQSQQQPQTQTQTQMQTQHYSEPHNQRPILSVNVQQPASIQPQVPLASAMPSSQPKSIPSSQPKSIPSSQPKSIPSSQPKSIPSSPSKTRSTEDALAPPHSPISPKGIAARLASMEPYNAPNVMSKPPQPVPIAESDNPDVIALRSALMILQVQRESARRDIKELQKLKEEAVKDPEAYVKELVQRSQSQNQESSRTSGGAVKEDLLAPTMRYLVDGLGEQSDFLKTDTESDTKSKSRSPSKKETKRSGKNENDEKIKNEDMDSNSASDSEDDLPKSKFAKAPKAQNIYRMPPVNWAKYQLAGAGLEKLHHDQQMRPTAGKPQDPPNGSEFVTERYVMAAPYEPVLDAVRMGHPSDHPMQTRRKGNRK